ncbi:MAG: OmpA family protein, partial [Acetobacteraceae bacterium]
AEALPAAGFRITNTNRDENQTLDATMSKDGVETWVRVYPSNGDGVHVTVLKIEPFRSTIVPLTAMDCAPVPGLRDFEANGAPQQRNYASMEFRMVEGGNATNVSKTGKTCQQDYGLRQGVPNKTDLEIMKNYAEALPAAGFKITNTDRNDNQTIDATMTKDGVETWVRVYPSNGNGMHVAVLQIEPFHSTLKAPQVAAPPPPPKTQLKITAQRGGQPLAGAWCAAFAPGSVTDPVGRAQSGDTREVAPGSYDAGCFIDENGGTTSGWLKNQAVGAGAVALAVEMPPLRRPVSDLALPAPAATPETVRPDQGDFPYLPSIPGSKLVGGRADPTPVYVQPADAKQPELVANGSIIKDYQSPPGVGLAELLGAYHTALLRAHWTIVNEFHRDGVVLIVHYGGNGRNIWGNLHLADAAYTIIVADATIDQTKLAADLRSQCHLALTGVLFDFDKATLKPESDAVLQQVAALMSRDGNLRLEVQGHTDSIGSDTYNQPLSEARARSVVVWLTQRGLAPNRLTARGYGKTRPIASNDTDAGRAQNRRVEIADPACRH